MLPVKGAIIVKHVILTDGKENGHSIPGDSESTAIVALPTAASLEFLRVSEHFFFHKTTFRLL